MLINNEEWDLDTNLELRPSRPTLIRDAGQIVSGRYPGEKEAKKLAKHWAEQGKKSRITRQELPKMQMNTTSFNFTIGTELRRVAVKMCAAVADLVGISEDLFDPPARGFLLGKFDQSDRVRIDWAIHQSLEKLRSPLSHLVFVKGNGQTGRCYGMVQFYGAFQLQVILNKSDYRHADFACYGRLDPVDEYREQFGPTELFGIPEAPVTGSREACLRAMSKWQQKFTAECKLAFGEAECDVTLDLP